MRPSNPQSDFSTVFPSYHCCLCFQGKTKVTEGLCLAKGQHASLWYSLPEHFCVLAHCTKVMSLIRALRATQTPTAGLTSQVRPQAVSRMGFAAAATKSKNQAAPFQSYRPPTHSSSSRDDSPSPMSACRPGQEKRREPLVTLLGPLRQGSMLGKVVRCGTLGWSSCLTLTPASHYRASP